MSIVLALKYTNWWPSTKKGQNKINYWGQLYLLLFPTLRLFPPCFFVAGFVEGKLDWTCICLVVRLLGVGVILPADRACLVPRTVWQMINYILELVSFSITHRSKGIESNTFISSYQWDKYFCYFLPYGKKKMLLWSLLKVSSSKLKPRSVRQKTSSHLLKIKLCYHHCPR